MIELYETKNTQCKKLWKYVVQKCNFLYYEIKCMHTNQSIKHSTWCWNN